MGALQSNKTIINNKIKAINNIDKHYYLNIFVIKCFVSIKKTG